MRGGFDSLRPHQFNLKVSISMKSYKTLLVLAALVSASFAFAEETKKETPAEPHKSKCCVKAATAGETCKHECCATAAKAGQNCEKCGGTNAPVVK